MFTKSRPDFCPAFRMPKRSNGPVVIPAVIIVINTEASSGKDRYSQWRNLPAARMAAGTKKKRRKRPRPRELRELVCSSLFVMGTHRMLLERVMFKGH